MHENHAAKAHQKDAIGLTVLVVEILGVDSGNY